MEIQSKKAIQFLYDGECPLCLREVNFLQKRDGGRGLIEFVNIADDGYEAQNYQGISFERAMGRIHAILPDGTIITDIEVFRQVYHTLGIGWIYGATKLPIVGTIADKIYDFWAQRRLAITRRANLPTIIKQREERIQEKNRCRLNNF